jgi:hypothetical protein
VTGDVIRSHKASMGTQRYFTNGQAAFCSLPVAALSGITSPARRGCLSHRRYLAALPSLVGRLQSRRSRDLRSWLRSCKSRTLFSGTRRRKRRCSCFVYRWAADSESRRMQGSGPTITTRQKEQQRNSSDLSYATIAANRPRDNIHSMRP